MKEKQDIDLVFEHSLSRKNTERKKNALYVGEMIMMLDACIALFIAQGRLFSFLCSADFFPFFVLSHGSQHTPLRITLFSSLSR